MDAAVLEPAGLFEKMLPRDEIRIGGEDLGLGLTEEALQANQRILARLAFAGPVVNDRWPAQP